MKTLLFLLLLLGSTTLATASSRLAPPLAVTGVPASLTNLAMPAKTFDGVAVQRRLMIANSEFSFLSFRTKRAELLVSIYHYTTRTDSTGAIIETPYEAGFAYGTGGILSYRLSISNQDEIDMRTMLPSDATTPAPFRAGEFDFFLTLTRPIAAGGQGMGLEQVIMAMMGKYVALQLFDQKLNPIR